MNAKRTILRFAAALACVAALPAHAQFPEQPVRISVGFPPGGPTDLVARVVGQAMEKRLGQPVLIENRPGASGNIAAEQVARAPGNGYSLLLGTTSVFAINPAIGRKTGFDPAKDFVAVGLIGIVPSFVIVPDGLPVKSMADLARYGKENRGKLTYASNGPGTLSHICSALISSIYGIDAVHVPYKGSAPAAQDLVSGRVSFTCDAFSAYRAFVEGGRLRVVATSTADRSPLLSAAPGMKESGLADFDLFTWYTIMAPASTPPAVVERLGKELQAAVDSADVREKLAAAGIDARSGSPAEVNALVKREHQRWVEAVKQSGAQVD